MNKMLMGIIAAVVLVAVAGGAFWGGMQVGKNQAEATRAQFMQQRFGAGQAGQQVPPAFATPGAAGENPLAGGTIGTVQRIEGQDLILETAEGELRVQTTETTLIRKTMTVQVGDLEEGERVVVMGSRNADGTITARSIQGLQGMRGALPAEQ